MTVELFDLAQRLHAQHTGEPAPRMVHAPVRRGTDPIAVAYQPRGGRPGLRIVGRGKDAHVRPAGAIAVLSDLGIGPGAAPPTLVTAGSAALRTLAAQRIEDADVNMVVRWWERQAEFPVSASVVDVVRACARRWVCGTSPEHDHDPGVWLNWLQVRGTGAQALLDLYEKVAAGTPLPVLAVMAEGERYAWEDAVSRFGDGLPTVAPRSAAALELRLRCDATDLLESGLMADPLIRARYVHYGDVVHGTLTPVPAQQKNKVERHVLESDRLESRLRPGQGVVGWIGRPDGDTSHAAFAATIESIGTRKGRLILNMRTSRVASQHAGARVTVMPTPVVPAVQAHGRRVAESLRRRGSWLTTRKPPPRGGRNVPMEVVWAAADADM